MRIAYYCLMKNDRDRVRAVVPDHVAYWRELRVPGYLGGPLADRSGADHVRGTFRGGRPPAHRERSVRSSGSARERVDQRMEPGRKRTVARAFGPSG